MTFTVCPIVRPVPEAPNAYHPGGLLSFHDLDLRIRSRGDGQR